MYSILITGGTGTLGNAIVDTLLKTDHIMLDRIIIYSRDEQKQESMYFKYKDLDKHNKLRYLIGDVRDKERLKLACRSATHIIHAAALKIVPSVEYNPMECIKTNILGAQNLIEVCSELMNVKNVLAISTDKAVNPINLYGCSKLAAEKLFIAANNINTEIGPRFSVARYGNVSGSRGSVIPLFKSQLQQSKNITITDPEMTRFWISIEDAARFVYSRVMGMQGREIFIPDMKSYKIIDLAKLILVNHCGFFEPARLTTIGVRPGEKTHEELISHYEMPYVDDYKDPIDGSLYFCISKYINPKNKEFMKFFPELGGYTSNNQIMGLGDLQQKMIDAGFIEYPVEVING